MRMPRSRTVKCRRTVVMGTNAMQDRLATSFTLTDRAMQEVLHTGGSKREDTFNGCVPLSTRICAKPQNRSLSVC
jgi:hypothetical protein